MVEVVSCSRWTGLGGQGSADRARRTGLGGRTAVASAPGRAEGSVLSWPLVFISLLGFEDQTEKGTSCWSREGAGGLGHSRADWLGVVGRVACLLECLSLRKEGNG